MVFSKYNNIVEVTSTTVALYNALTDKTLFLRKSDLENPSGNLKNKMVKYGFIVQDSLDETAQFVEYAKSVENSREPFHLIINPTINCNFNCWYCYEKHVFSKMKQSTILQIGKLVERLYKQHDNIQLSFFGGEPLLYYKSVMLPIFGHIKKYSHAHSKEFAVNMTTNGYLLNEKMVKELIEHYNFNGAQITLDGDREKHNKIRFLKNGEGSYDRIVDNVKLLAQYGVPVRLRINNTNENFSSLKNIAPDFSDLNDDIVGNIHIDMHIVWQENQKESLERKMPSVINSFKARRLNATKMTFREFCYADRRNQCVVHYNGDIYKCTAVDFENTKRDGFLSDEGIIVWEDNSLEKRMNSKFNSKKCLDCKILPLCHGGCSSFGLKNENGCVYNDDEEAIKRAIKDRIAYNISMCGKNNANIHTAL